MKPMLAGGAYFATVFAVGFIFGTIRIFLLEPQLGALPAALVETPFILTACWLLSGFWISRLKLTPALGARIIMGGLAFVLLVGAEFLLGSYGFDRTINEQVAAWATTNGAVGLAGQLLFASFPTLQLLSKKDS